MREKRGAVRQDAIVRPSTDDEATCVQTGRADASVMAAVVFTEATMYDLTRLAERVAERLAARPATRLGDIVKDFQVDRHTVNRALQLRFGKPFREIQAETLQRVVVERRRAMPWLSFKQIAAEVGYLQSSSLSRRLRRRR